MALSSRGFNSIYLHAAGVLRRSSLHIAKLPERAADSEVQTHQIISTHHRNINEVGEQTNLMHASAAIAPAVGLYVPAGHLRPEEEGGGASDESQ